MQNQRRTPASVARTVCRKRFSNSSLGLPFLGLSSTRLIFRNCSAVRSGLFLESRTGCICCRFSPLTCLTGFDVTRASSKHVPYQTRWALLFSAIPGRYPRVRLPRRRWSRRRCPRSGCRLHQQSVPGAHSRHYRLLRQVDLRWPWRIRPVRRGAPPV